MGVGERQADILWSTLNHLGFDPTETSPIAL